MASTVTKNGRKLLIPFCFNSLQIYLKINIAGLASL